MNAPIEKLSYTISQFRAATGYSKNKTYSAIARGDLRTFKDGKRRMISAEAAREFITRLERQTAEGTSPITSTPHSPGRKGTSTAKTQTGPQSASPPRVGRP